MDEKIQQLMDMAVKNGMLQERNRILEVLVKYKNAGWLDEGLITLLVEDICVDD